MLVHGAHGFKVIKNVQMLEIKQGPYINKLDKVKLMKSMSQKLKLKIDLFQLILLKYFRKKKAC